MAQITDQEGFSRERERERSRSTAVNTTNPSYWNAGIAVTNYPKAPALPIQTLSTYALPPPPPPPIPILPILGGNLGGSYPPIAQRSYPPLVLGNEASYPSMHWGPQCWTNPYQEGVAYAPPVLPDPINPSTELCAIHGKRRTLSYLKKNDKGSWVCISSSACKTVPNSSTALCAIHGKRRSLQNLTTNSCGDLVCESHDECIIVSERAGYKQICSAHGKLRSLTHLILTSPGIYVCSAGSVCF